MSYHTEELFFCGYESEEIKPSGFIIVAIPKCTGFQRKVAIRCGRKQSVASAGEKPGTNIKYETRRTTQINVTSI
jgi:hypothetical protein